LAKFWGGERSESKPQNEPENLTKPPQHFAKPMMAAVARIKVLFQVFMP
jgi:hypothetical protein